MVLPDSSCLINFLFLLRIPNLFLKINNVETHRRADEQSFRFLEPGVSTWLEVICSRTSKEFCTKMQEKPTGALRNGKADQLLSPNSDATRAVR